MSRTVSEDTPQMVRSVQGVSFHFYIPYVEGDTINAAEAAALNQTRCENIKNNVAGMVAEAQKKNDELTGTPDSPLSADVIAQLQAEITKYDLEYEFGMRRAGGRAGDPVEAEARDMAWELIKEPLKRKGIKVGDLTAEDRNRYIAQALDKYPQIRERAQRVVAARAEASTDLQLDL